MYYGREKGNYLMQLSAEKLDNLDPAIARPVYDRSAVTAGILHVGLGNFHRAHQEVYIDDLLSVGGDLSWGILGAGVMAADAGMREGLLEQDCLYTLVEQDGSGDSARIIGAMTGFLPVEEGHGPMIEAMGDPGIRIVSLTVTEGGYFIDAATGTFDLNHPMVQADLAAPESPTTVFGAIVAGLRTRRASGEKPFTVMSCDNVPHNGNVCRAAVLGIANAQDPGLGAWIADNVTFPNGMVDRITPATTPARVQYLADKFGVKDNRPVFCEPFIQWVLEDSFTNGRPALEKVGVQFVEDVTPYEHMKIRMLNGGHALIAYAGSLLGHTYAHEAMEDPLVSGFMEKVERDEVITVFDAVPDMSHERYLELIMERFANPRVEDTIQRLCFDGSNRQPKFIVASIVDRLAAGLPASGLALASALWCHYCEGGGGEHARIEPNDPDWEHLRTVAAASTERPAAWLEMSEIYGDLATNEAFASEFAHWLTSLRSKGAADTLRDYLGA